MGIFNNAMISAGRHIDALRSMSAEDFAVLKATSSKYSEAASRLGKGVGGPEAEEFAERTSKSGIAYDALMGENKMNTALAIGGVALGGAGIGYMSSSKGNGTGGAMSGALYGAGAGAIGLAGLRYGTATKNALKNYK